MCREAGERETRGIEDRHPAVFGHPDVPGRRQERLQLGKTVGHEARTSVFRARMRQWPDRADLTLGNEPDAETPVMARSDSVQKQIHPVASAEAGGAPVFQSEDVRAKPTYQRLNRAGGSAVVRLSRGPQAPVDQADCVAFALNYGEAHAAAVGIDCENS